MTVAIQRAALLIALIGVISGAFLVGRRLGAHVRRPLSGMHRILSADAGANSDYGVGGFAVNEQVTNVPPSDIFEQVLDYVQKQYVRSYGGERRLSDGAVSQMLAALDDPKTDFLTPEMSKARQSALLGRCYGVGAALTVTQTKSDDITQRYLTVVNVLSGSPADRCGLKSGDHITEIDGHWIIAYNIGDFARARHESRSDDGSRTADDRSGLRRIRAGYSLARALELLQAGEGKSHELTVERPNQSPPRKVNLTTALTRTEPAEFRLLTEGVGYLRVRQFNDRIRASCASALASSSVLKGLVLDLRQCSGGVTAAAGTGVDGYTPARDLIAMLTNGGNVATVERRPGQRQPLRVSAAAGRLSVPLAVLVDAGTANLAELVASALRDAGRAKLIGTHTFGDDNLQMYAPLKSGGAFEISTAHLYTASGIDLAGGLRPDINLGPAGVAVDGAIERAREVVRAGAL